MRQHRRCDAHVVIDDVFLGEAGGGIQNLLEIRQLQVSALNFNHGVGHVLSVQPLCLKPDPPQNGALTPDCRGAIPGLTTHLLPTYFQTSAPLARPNYVVCRKIRPAGGSMKHRSLNILVLTLILAAHGFAQDLESLEKRVAVK